MKIREMGIACTLTILVKLLLDNWHIYFSAPLRCSSLNSMTIRLQALTQTLWVKQLAIRLGCPKTTAKSLVIPEGEGTIALSPSGAAEGWRQSRRAPTGVPLFCGWKVGWRVGALMDRKINTPLALFNHGFQDN